MSNPNLKRLEGNLRAAGRNLRYPPTPHIATAVMARLKRPSPASLVSRRWAQALIVTLILLSTLMLVPPARAAILEFIQIGIVRIFPPAEVTPLPTAEVIRTAEPQIAPSTATPALTTTSLIPILESLAGETTLDEAQRAADFPILLPTYPPDLGLPDRVYFQNLGSPMVIFVWLDREQPERVRMSLHAILPGSWSIDKIQPRVVQQTVVNGQPAVWTEGPYMLQLTNRNYEVMRLIEGHVLIWTQDEITYRLETDLPLEEAVRVAESLQPLPAP